MRRYGTLIAIIGCGALVLLAIANWPYLKSTFESRVKNQAQELADQKKAEAYLEESMPHEALKIIHKHEEDIQYRTDIGKKWLDLLIQASVAVNDYPQLLILYDTYPQAFADKEKASIDVLEALLLASRFPEFDKLRQEWKGHETLKLDWLLLDARKLVAENDRAGAIALLQSKSFPGAQDTPRLVFLALLNIPDNPKAAWDYLTEADKKDPNNPEIHSYRAKLLESVGKPQLALLEYITAAQDAPNNPIFKDQLAEFYLRHNEYMQAMSIWTDILKKWPMDSVWLKALFWDKVVTPVHFDWSAAMQPSGKSRPYIEYLLHLKPDVFWDEAAFEKLPNSPKILMTQQSSFWLRLLEDLKEGKEKEALDLLQVEPFASSSWNSGLAVALKRVIMYRKAGTLNLESMPSSLDLAPNELGGKEAGTKTGNAFFDQLDALAKANPKDKNEPEIPNDLHELLLSKEVFAAAFLSAGWYEAALQLHTLKVLPEAFPDWVAIGFTEALRKNRGDEEALKFAMMQHPSQGLSLIIGELLAATKHTDTALENLKKLAKEPNEIGMRASWLISLIYIERGQYKEAKEAIDAQPRLAQDVLGKEALARIALLEGNTALAEKLYKEIENKSAEAKSYLARKAFMDKDWKKARELTEELLRQFPDNAVLRENLKKIIEEQQSQNSK